MRLSIVIPCYNEKFSIPLILERFNQVIGKRKIDVILVNNGSTDGSEKVFDELLPHYSFAHLVVVKENKGYGYGILQGLKAAEGDYIGWTHADMQTDPKDVVRAYNYLCKTNNKNLFLKGSRKGRPIAEVFFTKGMSLFESVYFGVPLSDINGQPNIFPREFYEKWSNPPLDFSLDLYVFYSARKHHLNIVRFPVEFTNRQFGSSKWNRGLKSKVKFIKKTIKFSYDLKRKEKESER